MSSLRYSLRQLEYFVAIAEAGSLSGAAEELRVSQSGLSQSLTDLERALKVQLAVRRKAHGVALTPTGTQVLRHARDLLRHGEDLANIAAGGDSLRGVLSLGCYVTLAPTTLPPLLEEFNEIHPDLRIDFVEGTQDVLQRRLLAGELDLAVLYDMELQPEMERAVIDTARPHVLLAAEHRFANDPTVSLADLAAEPMVLLDAPPSSHNTLAIFDRLGITPEVRYRPDHLRARARSGGPRNGLRPPGPATSQRPHLRGQEGRGQGDLGARRRLPDLARVAERDPTQSAGAVIRHLLPGPSSTPQRTRLRRRQQTPALSAPWTQPGGASPH